MIARLWAHVGAIYLYSQLMVVSQMMGECVSGERAARPRKVSASASDLYVPVSLSKMLNSRLLPMIAQWAIDPLTRSAGGRSKRPRGLVKKLDTFKFLTSKKVSNTSTLVWNMSHSVDNVASLRSMWGFHTLSRGNWLPGFMTQLKPVGRDEWRDLKRNKNCKRGEGGHFLLTVIYDRCEFHRTRIKGDTRERKKVWEREEAHIDEGRSRGERFLYCVEKVMSRWKERGGTEEDVSLARFNSTAGNVAGRRRGTKNSCHTLGESH